MSKFKHVASESWTIFVSSYEDMSGQQVLDAVKQILRDILVKSPDNADPDSIKGGVAIALQTHTREWTAYHLTVTYKSKSRVMIGLHAIFVNALTKRFPRSMYDHLVFEPPVENRTQTPLLMIEWEDIYDALAKHFKLTEITPDMKAWLEKEYGLYQLASDLKDGLNCTLPISELADNTFDNDGQLFPAFADAFKLTED